MNDRIKNGEKKNMKKAKFQKGGAIRVLLFEGSGYLYSTHQNPIENLQFNKKKLNIFNKLSELIELNLKKKYEKSFVVFFFSRKMGRRRQR